MSNRRKKAAPGPAKKNVQKKIPIVIRLTVYLLILWYSSQILMHCPGSISLLASITFIFLSCSAFEKKNIFNGAAFAYQASIYFIISLLSFAGLLLPA